MRSRQLAWGLAGIAGLVIAFMVGLYLGNVRTPTSGGKTPTDRLITISASGTDCEVDYPVTSMHASNNHIQWKSDDNPYWISFIQLNENLSNYRKEDPLAGNNGNFVAVPPGGFTPKFKVQYDSQQQDNYYMYAIYNQDPTSSPNNLPVPCKRASVEHDTGVIIKR